LLNVPLVDGYPHLYVAEMSDATRGADRLTEDLAFSKTISVTGKVIISLSTELSSEGSPQQR
jgi:hypothetical protein